MFSLGTAPMFTLTNDLIIGSAPPERAGAAAGISETAAELGGAAGIAVFGSMGVAIYWGAMENRLPDGVPRETAAIARDTLGSALEAAAELPGHVASALIEVARAGFMDGLHIAAAISALLTVGLAGLVATKLRKAGPASEGQDPGVEAIPHFI
jgi:MFS transporter, DHA2 family, multidrug resistance protein